MEDAPTVTLEVPQPPDEPERLALLASCHLDARPEPEFDDLARVAARICDAPVAYVSLLEQDRQWFKGKVGADVAEVPRRTSMCNHTIVSPGPVVIRDTLRDDRFAHNPFVVGPPGVRFYVGVPLRIDRGSAIGTLCVFDMKPRELAADQLEALEGLARQVSRELALRSELLRMRRAAAQVAAPAEGELIAGKWKIVRAIGQGGLGAVYEARDASGERVAIKCLLSEWAARGDMVERFAREARVLAALQSPHVARIIDVGNLDGTHGGVPFIAMEYLEGEDLRSHAARRGPVSWPEATRWLADACAGLAAAHAQGIVHRDVKPANLFLEQSGVVKVIDFGIAKLPTAQDPLTQVGTIIGSLRYMPPEQIMASDSTDPRGDVWSLGVVLHELLTAAPLFPGETDLQTVAAILNGRVPPLRELLEVPEHLDAIVLRCLEPDRARRFRDASELGAALRESALRA